MQIFTSSQNNLSFDFDYRAIIMYDFSSITEYIRLYRSHAYVYLYQVTAAAAAETIVKILLLAHKFYLIYALHHRQQYAIPHVQ